MTRSANGCFDIRRVRAYRASEEFLSLRLANCHFVSLRLEGDDSSCSTAIIAP
jgi:hypothetical protein